MFPVSSFSHQSLIPVPPVRTQIYPPSNADMRYRGYMHRDSHSQQYFIIRLPVRPLRPGILQINQNRSFCSVECDNRSVSPSPPWAGQLSLFFKLKHDLLRILTCDKLYTLLITCQLERWNCAF